MTPIFESRDSVLMEFTDADHPPKKVPLPESTWIYLLGQHPITDAALRNPSLSLQRLAELAREVTDSLRPTRRADLLAIALGNQALILKATGDVEGAAGLLQEQAAICQQLNAPNCQ